MRDKIEELGTKTEGGFLIKVKVVANSKQNSFEIVDGVDYFIKLKISKPAVDGKANEEIIKYLSKVLNLPKNNISIVRGEKSSLKMLFVEIR